MNRAIALGLLALPLFIACAASGTGGSGGGSGVGGGGAGTGAGPDSMSDAGVMDAPMDAPPDVVNPDSGACKLAKPYSSSDADCNVCAEASCCAEVNACLLDADCDDGYVNCAIGCALEATDAGTDPACLDDCAKQYPQGAKEYDAAIGCVDTACSAACQ